MPRMPITRRALMGVAFIGLLPLRRLPGLFPAGDGAALRVGVPAGCGGPAWEGNSVPWPGTVEVVVLPSFGAVRDRLDCAPAQGGLDVGILPAGTGPAELCRFAAGRQWLLLRPDWRPDNGPLRIAAARRDGETERWVDSVLAAGHAGPAAGLAVHIIPAPQITANLACGALHAAVLEGARPAAPEEWGFDVVAARPAPGRLALAAGREGLKRNGHALAALARHFDSIGRAAFTIS